jgi:hypothetical protein
MLRVLLVERNAKTAQREAISDAFGAQLASIDGLTGPDNRLLRFEIVETVEVARRRRLDGHPVAGKRPPTGIAAAAACA